MKRFIVKSNIIYYMYRYWIDKYQDYKRIRIDKKEPMWGFYANACGRKYCLDCGGSWWREKYKEIGQKFDLEREAKK